MALQVALSFSFGRNFIYESALRLRVLHKVNKNVVKSQQTKWIDESDIFTQELQTQARDAIGQQQHFAGLLQVVTTSGGN